jgi:enoyl-CoA hydratase/carnithine racemase
LACVVTKDGASAEREAERLAERVCAMPKGAASALKRAINDGLDLKTVREEERRRAFESYRKYAREKFAAFNSRRTKSKL